MKDAKAWGIVAFGASALCGVALALLDTAGSSAPGAAMAVTGVVGALGLAYGRRKKRNNNQHES